MSEKRFNIAYGGNVITDEDGRDLDITVKWCVEELVDKLNEQQAIISDLKEENEQLQKELNDCEKFRYTVFKRMGELNDERRTKRN